MKTTAYVAVLALAWASASSNARDQRETTGKEAGLRFAAGVIVSPADRIIGSPEGEEPGERVLFGLERAQPRE